MALAAPLAERKITLIMVVYLLRRRHEEESSDLNMPASRDLADVRQMSH